MAYGTGNITEAEAHHMDAKSIIQKVLTAHMHTVHAFLINNCFIRKKIMHLLTSLLTLSFELKSFCLKLKRAAQR